jgi:outer membrane scaffolding protein for murein synthesis (MipA/OmpV family)
VLGALLRHLRGALQVLVQCERAGHVSESGADSHCRNRDDDDHHDQLDQREAARVGSLRVANPVTGATTTVRATLDAGDGESGVRGNQRSAVLRPAERVEVETEPRAGQRQPGSRLTR